MQRSLFLIWISLLLAVGSTAQDTVNVVSDSAFNAFILNHKPLTAGELNRFRLERDYKNVYGIYVSTYLNDPSTYPIQQKAMGTYVTKRRVNHIEWIFYSFAGLFLLLALIRNFWREYFDKVFKTEERCHDDVESSLGFAESPFCVVGKFFYFLRTRKQLQADGIGSLADNTIHTSDFVFCIFFQVFFSAVFGMDVQAKRGF
jgi:hypothetical protein